MGNRILLADDSITIQKVVNLTFADEGIEVVSVSNGDMAEKRLSEVNPDLVLADIFMPGKNGYELCESIKQNPQFSNVPVVLLVGAFEPFDQAEARRVRADAHLTKPFESRTLVETVRKLISTTTEVRTGSLSAPTPAEQQGERGAQEQASGPITQPSAKQDTSAMYSQAAPTTQPTAASGHSTAPPATEGAHAGPGQDMADDAGSFQPLEVQLSSMPYQERPDPSPASLWMDQAEATTTVSDDEDHRSDPFDFGALDVSAQSSDDSASMSGDKASDTIDLMSGFENVDLDLEPLESELAAGFRVDDQEMVLDLERPYASYTHEAENASIDDLASDVGANFNSGGLLGRPVQSSSWDDTDVLKTQMLELPNHVSHAEERIDTNPLEMPPASEFHRSSAAPVGSAELREEESSSSTLLAVDDPLGDVLMDEPEMGVLSYEAQRSSPIVFAEQPAYEEFNLEFNPQEQKVFELPQPAATTTSRTTGELVEPAHYISEEPPIPVGAMELEAEPYARGEEAVAEAQPQVSYESAEANSGFEPSASATGEATEQGAKAERPESGFEFDSEFQTATPTRVPDQDEYSFAGLKENIDEAGTHAPATEFTSSAMWNEQEARFAPIDIEANPVEEFEAAPATVARGAMETDFEIAPETEQEHQRFADAPIAESSAAEEALPAEAAAETAEVSPALMDEIVRRVVSQMTESVVREIAWEVVPDVVERVIKEMARDEASKRV